MEAAEGVGWCLCLWFPVCISCKTVAVVSAAMLMPVSVLYLVLSHYQFT